ncbi:hypothetical protein AB1Y20_010980 [Prymnesium parvum]|uniref:EF-hand domain-containing protein n=1 Tax=Prymnesium parvum TaxID=97485 RepID=A0AB34IN96_PRYPA
MAPPPLGRSNSFTLGGSRPPEPDAQSDSLHSFTQLGLHAHGLGSNAGEAAHKYIASPLSQLSDQLGASALMDSSKKGWSKLSLSVATNIDKAIISNARNVLHALGGNLKKQLHIDGMPNAIHDGVDIIFNAMWPEIQKDILDGILLGKGLSFRVYRREKRTTIAPPPTNPFVWFKATLLYAINGYDQTNFGSMRSPVFFTFYLMFLFPAFGVADIFVILNWFFMEKFDKHQLVSFITRSKALAFVTSGLVAATAAFVKLYVCIFAEQGSRFSCPAYAPGMHKTFLFEFYLYMLRTLLVWISGLLLWKFDEVTEWKKQYDQARARMAAVPRRGLLAPVHSGVAIAAAWLLWLATLWYALGGPQEISDAMGNVMDGDVAVDLTDWVANVYNYAELLLATVQVLFLTTLLVTPMLNGFFASVLVLVSTASCVLLALLARQRWSISDAVHLVVDAPSAASYEQILALVLCAAVSVLTLLHALLLVHAQHVAAKSDDKLRAKLEQAMRTLDKDSDGEVSKAEFKEQFHLLFPNARFELIWKELDRNGDGSLSMTELAAHFGMSHLVKHEEPIKDDNVELLNVEERLAQMVATSTLSKKAGGLIVYFLLWDFLSFVLTYSLLFAQFYFQAYAMKVLWHRHLALYTSKIIIAIFSIPFLVFFIPVLSSALTHTKPSGYDRLGVCRHKLPHEEIVQRYIIKQNQRIAQYNKMKRGEHVGCLESIELRWNALLGFREYDMKDLKKAQKHAKSIGVDMQIAQLPPTNKPPAAAKGEAKEAKGAATKEAKGAATKEAKGAATKEAKGGEAKEAKGGEAPRKARQGKERMCEMCQMGAPIDAKGKGGRLCDFGPEAQLRGEARARAIADLEAQARAAVAEAVASSKGAQPSSKRSAMEMV